MYKTYICDLSLNIIRNVHLLSLLHVYTTLLPKPL